MSAVGAWVRTDTEAVSPESSRPVGSAVDPVCWRFSPEAKAEGPVLGGSAVAVMPPVTWVSTTPAV